MVCSSDICDFYNIFGFRSTCIALISLNVYGTLKQAIAHFSKAFVNELKGTGVIMSMLQPGIMSPISKKASIPDTYNNAEDQKIYNILGNLPDVTAKYLVKKMIVIIKMASYYLYSQARK